MMRTAAIVCGLAVVLAGPGVARADDAAPAPTEPPSPTPPPPGEEEDLDETQRTVDPDEGIPRPAAEDLLSGHFLLALGAGVVAPSSDLLPEQPEVGTPNVGVGASLHLGVGVSRSAVLQLDGAFAWLTSRDLCDGCRTYAIDAGASVAYHVAQGIAFDPWISYGLGYRHVLLSLPDRDDAYHGFDFAKIGVGGDFYPVPSVGVGPFIETDVGVRFGDDPSVYAAFIAGARVAFDPLRDGVSLAPTSARR